MLDNLAINKSDLRHTCNTRYRWLARPYRAGPFTLQDTPSFAWCANACISGRFVELGLKMILPRALYLPYLRVIALRLIQMLAI